MGGSFAVCLASVDVRGVPRFRAELQPLAASLTFQCSSLVARWVDLEPLGSLLQAAVSGGAPLADELWSAVRAPRLHAPDDVKKLSVELGRAWLQAEQTPVACDDFFIGEIGRVVQLFAHAAARDEAVVSAVLPVCRGEGGPELRLFHD